MGKDNSPTELLPLLFTIFSIATFFFIVRLVLFPVRQHMSSTPYEYNRKRVLPSLLFTAIAYSAYTAAFALYISTRNYGSQQIKALEITAIWASKAAFSAHYYFLPKRWMAYLIHLFLATTYVVSLALILVHPVPFAVAALDIASTLVLTIPILAIWPKPVYVLLCTLSTCTCALSIAYAVCLNSVLIHVEAGLAVLLTSVLALRLQPPPEQLLPKRPPTPPPATTHEWPGASHLERGVLDFTNLGVLPDRLPSILPSIDSRDPDACKDERPPLPLPPGVVRPGAGARMAEMNGWGNYTDTEKGTETELDALTPATELTGMTWGSNVNGWGVEGGGVSLRATTTRSSTEEEDGSGVRLDAASYHETERGGDTETETLTSVATEIPRRVPGEDEQDGGEAGGNSNRRSVMVMI